MTVLDLKTHASSDNQVQAAVCVIGGGMAGLTLALRLAKAGQKVALLESGGDGFDPDVHELNRVGGELGRFTRSMDGRYRGLGGSSSEWGGRLIPVSPVDTRRRDYIGLPAWPFPIEELFPYYGEIEKLFSLAPGPFDETASDGVDPEGTMPRGDPDYTVRWAKWPKFRNCSLANLHRKTLHADRNIELWLNATVTGFDLDPSAGRLSAIIASNAAGKRVTVRATHFIMAAGTIETTRLLLWLKETASGQVFARAPALGLYFQDHVNVRVARIGRKDAAFANRFCTYRFHRGTRRSLHLELTQAAQQEAGVASAFAFVSLDLDNSSLDFTKRFARSLQSGETTPALALEALKQVPLMMQIGWTRYVEQRLHLPPDVDTHIELCAEQLPDERNLIELSEERDILGMPKASIRWRPMAADERTLRAAADRLAAYWTRHDLHRRVPLEWIEACRDPEGQISDTAVDYAHPAGTARMGTNRNSSVVGPDLVCHDVPNLSVVSAAVFPPASSANPTFTLLALAMRHADALLSGRALSSRSGFGSSQKAGPTLSPALS